ncbi:hypothetical protein ACFL2Q_09195 [Thermodesulfobacteriota bacterium]
MSHTNRKPLLAHLFPSRRLDRDFPLLYWFAGLWFYLKSFLYVCYLYGLGLEPELDTSSQIEVIYFAVVFIPCFLLARALWNEKHWAFWPSLVFLLVDTPFQIFHVIHLAAGGYMESTLTRILEYGALGLNMTCIGWFTGYWVSSRTVSSRG